MKKGNKKATTYWMKTGSYQGSHLRHIHTQAIYHHHGCKIHTSAPHSCAVHLTIVKLHLRTDSPPALIPLPVASQLPLSHLLIDPDQSIFIGAKLFIPFIIWC